MNNANFKRTCVAIRKNAEKRIEENGIFFSNHLKKLADEQNMPETVVTPDSNGGNEIYEFTASDYRLMRFSDLVFGKNGTVPQDEHVKVVGVCFYYTDFRMCGFSNISFINCRFVGCNFIECYTLGFQALFENCDFTCQSPGIQNIDDMPSTFANCEISARFCGCNISRVVLNKCNFYFCSFTDIGMYDTIFLDCSLDTTKFDGCDMRNTKIINPKFIEFYIEDSGARTKFSRGTFLGEISYNKSEEREVRYAAQVYGAFSELFESSKIADWSGEYFYLSKAAEMRNQKGADKVKSVIGLITCGYGEKPFYSLIVSLCLIVVCGILYMLFGVVSNNEVIVYRPTPQHPLPSFADLVVCCHFSLVTFSTTGYGNVTPVGGSFAVSGIEMVLGVIMVGIWVSTLVRKMVR